MNKVYQGYPDDHVRNHYPCACQSCSETTPGSNAKHPTRSPRAQAWLGRTSSLPRPLFLTLTLKLSAMTTSPQFLSGNQAAIDEFLSRFDVSLAACTGATALTSCYRSSSSTATVCRHAHSLSGMLPCPQILDLACATLTYCAGG
jgi:hypothetical protein